MTAVRSPTRQAERNLFGEVEPDDRAMLPTFADCRRAAIHRWYPMVIGFSRTAVAAALRDGSVRPGNVVLDPFVGCGTTCVAAKAAGIESVGVDAHPFLSLVSRVKTAWDEYFESVGDIEDTVTGCLQSAQCAPPESGPREVPEFVAKLFVDRTHLSQLNALWAAINQRTHANDRLREFLAVALVRAAYRASPAKIDGVYIAPSTHKRSTTPPLAAFRECIDMMVADIRFAMRNCRSAPAHIIEGDARSLRDIATSSVSLVFTSPPYLNNFDYAEMTRFELYLLGMADCWGDISRLVRSKLIVNATTQIVRNRATGKEPDPGLPYCVRERLLRLSAELAELRRTKPGHKAYDYTVVAYFNDMLKAIREIRRVLKPGAMCRMIVGDSALYGLHVPTDELLRQVAIGVGFAKAELRPLRDRGHRWILPRRAYVPLRESEITLWK